MSLSDLEYAYLQNNQISDIDALLGNAIIDDGDAGYFEDRSGWVRVRNPGALDRDHRIANLDCGR